jgi:hypothetical protein
MFTKLHNDMFYTLIEIVLITLFSLYFAFTYYGAVITPRLGYKNQSVMVV